MEDSQVAAGRLDNARPVGGGVVSEKATRVSRRTRGFAEYLGEDGRWCGKTDGLRRRYVTRVGAIAAVRRENRDVQSSSH